MGLFVQSHKQVSQKQNIPASVLVNNDINLLQYYRKMKDGMIVINDKTIASVLSIKKAVTQEQVKEARMAMYAPKVSLMDAKKAQAKTRVSVSGKVKKVSLKL